jgi:hypothetical protein
MRLTGGDTSVTTAPGIAAALLGHGIVPIATLPGTEGARIGGSGVTVRFTFPVTGGWLNAAKLRGTIWHKGGIFPRQDHEVGNLRTRCGPAAHADYGPRRQRGSRLTASEP